MASSWPSRSSSSLTQAYAAASSSVQLADVLGSALSTGIGGAMVAAAATFAVTRRDALAAVFALMTAVSFLGVLVARRFPPDPAAVRTIEVLRDERGAAT